MSLNRIGVVSLKLERSLTGIHFSPAGDFLYGYDGRTIFTWNVPNFDEVGRFSVTESECSEQGRCQFLSGGRRIVLFASDDYSEKGIHHVTVRDLVSHSLLVDAGFQVSDYGLLKILFNNSESTLYVRDCIGFSHFIDFPSCTVIRSIEFDAETFGDRGHSSGPTALSPDEATVWVVCGYDDEVRGYREYLTSYDAKTGEGIRRVPPSYGNFIDGLQLTPNNDVLLAVEENALCLRDPKSWNLMGSVDFTSSWIKGRGEGRRLLAVSPCSSYAAAVCERSSRVCIVDLAQTRQVAAFEIDVSFWVNQLSFSPDDRYLVITGYDNGQYLLRIWDLSRNLGT